jgi:hypothetical protein
MKGRLASSEESNGAPPARRAALSLPPPDFGAEAHQPAVAEYYESEACLRQVLGVGVLRNVPAPFTGYHKFCETKPIQTRLGSSSRHRARRIRGRLKETLAADLLISH